MGRPNLTVYPGCVVTGLQVRLRVLQRGTRRDGREIAGSGPPRPGARNQDRRKAAGWLLAGRWHGEAGQAAPAELAG